MNKLFEQYKSHFPPQSNKELEVEVILEIIARLEKLEGTTALRTTKEAGKEDGNLMAMILDWLHTGGLFQRNLSRLISDLEELREGEPSPSNEPIKEDDRRTVYTVVQKPNSTDGMYSWNAYKNGHPVAAPFFYSAKEAHTWVAKMNEQAKYSNEPESATFTKLPEEVSEPDSGEQAAEDIAEELHDSGFVAGYRSAKEVSAIRISDLEAEVARLKECPDSQQVWNGYAGFCYGEQRRTNDFDFENWKAAIQWLQNRQSRKV